MNEKMSLQFDNYRQIKIIKILMDKEKPVKCSEFAAVFNVSERLIREDIKSLKHILHQCDVKLLSKRGIGYYLSVGQVDLEEVIHTSLGTLYYYDNVGVIDKFAREQLLLRYLILKNKAIKPQQIMEDFYISRTTLKKDLERAKETIEHYPITLVTVPYHGIYLKGSEVGKRMLLNRETAFYKDKSIFHMLNERIEMNGITIEDLLHFVENNSDIELSNIDLYNLYAHFNIMLLRVLQEQYIKEEELNYLSYVKEGDVDAVKKYLSNYEDFKGIPKSEYIYFFLLILSSGPSKKMGKYEELHKIRFLLLMLCEEIGNDIFLQEVEQDLSKLWMALEVKALNNFSSSPLLVRDIKKYKPLAIDLAYRFSNFMKQEHNLCLFDNDICSIAHIFQKHLQRKDIALKILVISARGAMFTKGLLMEELKKMYKKECFLYCDLYDLNNYDITQISFILTDNSLAYHQLPVPVIKLDFFNLEKSRMEIEYLCQIKRQQIIEKELKNKIRIDANCKEEVLLWYAQFYGCENNYKDWLVREEKLTFEVNKKLAVICVYQKPNIPTVIVEFQPFLWKNAKISHAIFISYHSDESSSYFLYEQLIANFDSYINE